MTTFLSMALAASGVAVLRETRAHRPVDEGAHYSWDDVECQMCGGSTEDESATLKDVREAVETLENLERTARRVFGGEHPLTGGIEEHLQNARAALRAREMLPSQSA